MKTIITFLTATLTVALITLTLTLTPVYAGQNNKEAMFGLDWGMTPEQVMAAGAALEKEEYRINTAVYSADSLPMNLNQADYYYLFFGDDEGLAKIIVYTKKITGDIYGTDGKDRFKGIVEILDKKYTRKDVHNYIGLAMYKEDAEFYQCLAYAGCGYWYAEHTAEDRYIGTELKGISRGVGRISLLVEWQPVWGDIVDARKEIQKQQEASAL
jgi:hypothetical protein